MRRRTWPIVLAILAGGLALAERAAAQGDASAVYGANPFATPGGGHEGHFHSQSHGGLDALHGASVPLGPALGPGMVPPPGMPIGPPTAGPPAYGPALPPGPYQPWPTISPYEHGRSQHRWWDGLWYRDEYDGGRQWYSRIGITFMSPRRVYGSPIELVGDPEVYGTADNGIPTANGFTVVSNKVFIDDPNPLAGRDFLQDRTKLKGTPGFRGSLGYIEPADTGLEFTAWFTPNDNAIYKRGTGDFGLTFVDDPFNGFFDLHALGLPDGPVPFDLLFQLEYQSTSAGGSADWLTNDVWPSDHKSLRVLYGVRYVYIWEEFSFRGVDSGANTATGRFNRQALNSSVESNLMGPQIGLDYSFGGDTLLFAGQSKAGVMLNVTDYKLGGFGIGDPLRNPLYDENFTFSEEQEHAHLTPLIEQNLRLEMDVFPLIPVLKKSTILQNAKLHAGYWVVLGWEIARPHSQIVYLNQPDGGPRLKSHLSEERTQWYTHGWDFGVDFRW